ncbi:MAG: pilin protein MshC [Rhodocyclales bacterium]|nr:pilin protein MshC [Rhodocyclales bacterium]
MIPPRDLPSRPRTGQYGFTLIEVIFVMVIMGILLTVAVPLLSQNDSRERSITEQLRSTLRHAQRVAVTRNRDVCVSVTVTTVIFRVASSSGTGVACTAQLAPFSDAGDTLDMSTAGSALRFSSAGNFRFTPTGVLTNNAGTALTARSIAVVRGATAFTFATLTIQPDNGFVLASAF